MTMDGMNGKKERRSALWNENSTLDGIRVGGIVNILAICVAWRFRFLGYQVSRKLGICGHGKHGVFCLRKDYDSSDCLLGEWTKREESEDIETTVHQINTEYDWSSSI